MPRLFFLLNKHKRGNQMDIRKQNGSSAVRKPFSTQTVVGIAVFSALAFVVSLLIRVPVQFLTFDAKDAIIAITAFIYGPITAPIISFFAAFIELVTISDTGWYGFLMNFVSSATYSLVASLIYSKFRSLNGALVGIYSAVVITTSAMLGLNILITPIYMREFLGVPMTADGVINMIPTILLPFNFAKTLMNSAVVMLLYKPVTLSLSRVGLLSKKTSAKISRGTVVIIAAGVISLVLAIVIFTLLSSGA